jgi:hypothetical protein
MRSSLLIPGAVLAAVLLVPAVPATAAAPTLSGTVRLGADTRAGVPVAWFEPGSRVVTATTTDAEGHYALPAPPAGTRYIVAANVRGVLSEPRAAVASHLATYIGAGPDDVPAAALVEPAVSDGGDRDLDVTADAATLVRGAHPAFARRQVRLMTLGGREAATVDADAKGAWSFRAAPGGYRIEVPGTTTWLDYRSKPFAVPGGETVVKRSSPVRAGTIAGRLTWHGKAAAKVRVWLQGPSRSEEPDDDPVRTDASGRFRFPGLLPGRFTVRFGNTGDGDDRTRFVVAKRERTVHAGRTTVVDAALVRGASVDGRFDPADGARTYTVQVRRGDATGPLARTFSRKAARGTAKNPVQLFGLRGGTYTVQVVDALGARYASRTLHLRTGVRTAIGTLRPTTKALTISGHVPGGASVSLREGVLSKRVVAGADGAYALRGLVPGRYEVQAQLRGRAPVTVHRTLRTSAVVDLPAGDAAVVRTGTVTGRLTAGAIDLPVGELTIDGGQGLLVQDGRLNAPGIDAGLHRITAVRVPGNALFPLATPYDVAWPGTDRSFTVPDGGTVDLGAVALDVTG